MSGQQAVAAAFDRGFEASRIARRHEGEMPNLSGEWAGESIPELLGDLIALAEADYGDDASAIVCEAWEEGCEEGFSGACADCRRSNGPNAGPCSH